ncbi:hypothetical protein IMAU30002_00334 [Lactobacillus helveticus]|uniref:hypothetical protein n=1 Tax=Lactobacillus helveticus TaxID=1587 RepID=UPI001562CA9D|nr:hypothetical protein [Lactobacillus helveticus]NRO38210.1 hypothetical protein [Lactobacillus helveticus]
MNFKLLDEISLGKRNHKVDLKKYALNWLDNNLNPNAPLIKHLTSQLRDTLDVNYSKQKELKQVALRGLISVL